MMVMVAPGYASRKYHTDPDCHYVRDRHREWPREQAEEWDYEHCKYCKKTAQKVEA
jgi:hypothetical protein